MHTHTYIQTNASVYARVGNEEGFAVLNAFFVVILSINFTFTFCCAAGQPFKAAVNVVASLTFQLLSKSITIKSGRQGGAWRVLSTYF